MPTLRSSSTSTNSTMNSNNNAPNPPQKYKVNEKVIVTWDDQDENEGCFFYEATITSYNSNDGTYDIVFPYDNKLETGIKEDEMKNFADLKIELEDKGIKLGKNANDIRFLIGESWITMSKHKRTPELSVINFVATHFDNPQISKFKAFIRIMSTINLQTKANEKFFKRLLDATFETVNLFTNYDVLEEKGSGFLQNKRKFSKIVANVFKRNELLPEDIIILKDRMCDYFTQEGIIDKTTVGDQIDSSTEEINFLVKDINKCEHQILKAKEKIVTYANKTKNAMGRKLDLENRRKDIHDFGNYLKKCSGAKFSLNENTYITEWLEEGLQRQQSKLQTVTDELHKITEIEQKLKEENYSTLRKLESGLKKKKRKMEVKMKKLKSLELQLQKIEVGEHGRYWREITRKRAKKDARLARERAEEDARRAEEDARVKKEQEKRMREIRDRKRVRLESFEDVAQNNNNSSRLSKRTNRSCAPNGAFTTTTTTTTTSSSSSSNSTDSNSLSLSRNDATSSRSPSTYALNNYDADGATKNDSMKNRRGWVAPLQTWMSGRPKLF